MIQRDALSVRERMSKVLTMISAEGFTDYTQLFTIEEGRRGVIVTILALLELVKEQLIDMVQSESFAASVAGLGSEMASLLRTI